MTLKNYLLVVNNIECSKAFYKEIFGLQVVKDFGENVILSGGLVLQEKFSWEDVIGRKAYMGEHNAALYFEEPDIEGFVKKLETSAYEVRCLNPLTDYGYKKCIRIYDPDGHVIEVGHFY